MSIKIRFSTPLQRLTQGKAEVDVKGKDIREVIKKLETMFPGIKERLYDENGNLRMFINIYVNDEDVRLLQLDRTPLKDGSEVSIVSAITGG
jgi:molybdopterin synthase sulfur carrier subunit